MKTIQITVTQNESGNIYASCQNDDGFHAFASSLKEIDAAVNRELFKLYDERKTPIKYLKRRVDLETNKHGCFPFVFIYKLEIINVTPAARINISWDDYFENICAAVALKSKDRTTQVGCIIVGQDRRIRSTGYNGFPIGVNDDVEDRHASLEKYDWTEHAERNAIYSAANVGTPLVGTTIYTRIFPCIECARGIIQTGIIRLVTARPESAWDGDPGWRGKWRKTLQMFGEACVDVRFYGAPKDEIK